MQRPRPVEDLARTNESRRLPLMPVGTRARRARTSSVAAYARGNKGPTTDSPHLGRIRPKSALSVANGDQHRRELGRFGPKSAKVGTASAEFGPRECGRLWPIRPLLVRFGPVSTDLGPSQCGATDWRHRSDLAEKRYGCVSGPDAWWREDDRQIC